MINQSGHHNYAGASTDDGGLSTVTVNQTGHHNEVNSKPNGSNFYGEGIGAGTWGANNIVTVDQDGHHNKAYADAADTSIIDIDQSGHHNEAYAQSEWGVANEIDIDQTGGNHFADVYVSGDLEGDGSNMVYVTQTDINNSAVVSSIGFGNTVTITQGM